ncbi:MAG: GxxExxY protein [Bacteroidota bacterium]|nr:GxxExxY protein [Bacteroidota bacterium]
MTENDITSKIIGCAIEVHRELGPGLLESAYEECLYYELKSNGILVSKQVPMPLIYKDIRMDCGYRIDLLVENKIIVEIKAVELVAEITKAQLMTYLKLANLKVGLIINFNVKLLKDGIIRWVV